MTRLERSNLFYVFFVDRMFLSPIRLDDLIYKEKDKSLISFSKIDFEGIEFYESKTKKYFHLKVQGQTKHRLMPFIEKVVAGDKPNIQIKGILSFMDENFEVKPVDSIIAKNLPLTIDMPNAIITSNPDYLGLEFLRS
jgi:hypothetical protein